MPHKPGHKREPGNTTLKGTGGSAGGSAAKIVPPLGSAGGSVYRGLPPLKRVADPGFMKKPKKKPVAPKPTRYDNRKVAK